MKPGIFMGRGRFLKLARIIRAKCKVKAAVDTWLRKT